MSSLALRLPNEYHIVWLDEHIGKPDFCLQLKRAFFTHVDPDSDQEVHLGDTDINQLIHSQSEIPVTFDSFHCTLKAFVDEAACLQYIDKIQHHRILFIASSRLGESAVKQLIERYPHSFTNAQTHEPYDSIYIFCTDILKASQWAAPYAEYVQIYDFEADLLARMTKDLGEEFLKHAKDLLEGNEDKIAIERLSWAKSLFIRYDKLKSSNMTQSKQQLSDANTSGERERFGGVQSTPSKQPKPSQQLQEIDRLFTLAEERVKEQEQNDLDNDGFTMETISSGTIAPVADHLIVWLDELFSSYDQVEAESEYETNTYYSASVQTDDFNTRNLLQLKHQVDASFSDIPENIRIFHDVDQCHQCIRENTGTKTIFLITSCSTAKKIFPRLTETWRSLKQIYVLGGYISDIVDWLDRYHEQGIDILLFDLHQNLLIRLLQDISKHYISKGKNFTSDNSCPTNSVLVYFDWAKKLVIHANQLAQSDFQNQLEDIETHKSGATKLITRTDSNDGVEQRLRRCMLEEDGDSVPVIFVVGQEMKVSRLNSDIAQLITCTTNNQVVSAMKEVEMPTRIIIVSPTLPSDDVLSLAQLLTYYCFSKSETSTEPSATNRANVNYVHSIDHLISQLYHKLGQYYRDRALQASIELEDRNKIMRLLHRSTQCYKLLQDDTKKALQDYAEMLKKSAPRTHQ